MSRDDRTPIHPVGAYIGVEAISALVGHKASEASTVGLIRPGSACASSASAPAEPPARRSRPRAPRPAPGPPPRAAQARQPTRRREDASPAALTPSRHAAGLGGGGVHEEPAERR